MKCETCGTSEDVLFVQELGMTLFGMTLCRACWKICVSELVDHLNRKCELCGSTCGLHTHDMYSSPKTLCAVCWAALADKFLEEVDVYESFVSHDHFVAITIAQLKKEKQ